MTVSKKITVVLLCVVMLTAAVFLMLISWNIGRTGTIGEEPPEVPSDLAYAVDQVSVTDTSVRISGWAMVIGEVISTSDCSVVLKGEKSGQMIELPTMIQERPDLNQVFSDGIDYTNAGFLAQVKTEKLDLSGEDYKICLQYKSNGHAWLLETQDYAKKIRETNWNDAQNESLLYNIDAVRADNRSVTVEGWMLQEGVSSEAAKVTVLLLNGRTGAVYELPTKIIERVDLDEVFPDGAGYRKAGFTTTIEVWRFDWRFDWHEVCLRYQLGDNVYDVQTGQIITIER